MDHMGCLLGSIGDPLGDLWGRFGRQKGDHRTWAKNGTGTKKKKHPLWGTFGSKMAPQGTKMGSASGTFST